MSAQPSMPKAVVIASRRPAKRFSIQATIRSGGESSPISVSMSRTICIRAPLVSLVPTTKNKKARRTCLRAGYHCESEAR